MRGEANALHAPSSEAELKGSDLAVNYSHLNPSELSGERESAKRHLTPQGAILCRMAFATVGGNVLAQILE